MAIGLSAPNLANKWLGILNNTAFAPVSTIYVQLHTGDPGANGTASPSAVTTRYQVSYNSANGGTVTMTGTNPNWSMTASESITAISHWDAATAGDFLWSASLAAPQNVNPGDTFTLTSDGLTLAPLAA